MTCSETPLRSTPWSSWGQGRTGVTFSLENHHHHHHRIIIIIPSMISSSRSGQLVLIPLLFRDSFVEDRLDHVDGLWRRAVVGPQASAWHVDCLEDLGYDIRSSVHFSRIVYHTSFLRNPKSQRTAQFSLSRWAALRNKKLKRLIVSKFTAHFRQIKTVERRGCSGMSCWRLVPLVPNSWISNLLHEDPTLTLPLLSKSLFSRSSFVEGFLMCK